MVIHIRHFEVVIRSIELVSIRIRHVNAQYWSLSCHQMNILEACSHHSVSAVYCVSGNQYICQSLIIYWQFQPQVEN